MMAVNCLQQTYTTMREAAPYYAIFMMLHTIIYDTSIEDSMLSDFNKRKAKTAIDSTNQPINQSINGHGILYTCIINNCV